MKNMSANELDNTGKTIVTSYVTYWYRSCANGLDFVDKCTYIYIYTFIHVKCYMYGEFNACRPMIGLFVC